MADDRRAVVLDNGRKSRGRPATAGHPTGELVVPDAVMTAKKLAIGHRKIGNLITLCERESTLLWFRRILIVFFQTS